MPFGACKQALCQRTPMVALLVAGCAWAAAARPPAPQLKAELARILADPRYQQAPLTWWQRLLGRLLERLLQWLDGLGSNFSALYAAWPALYWAIVGLLGLVLVALLYHLGVTIGNAFVERKPRQAAPSQAPAPDPEALRARAQELAAAGNWPEAFRVLYEALLRRLDRRDLLRWDPSRTNWETVAALQGRPELADIMKELAPRLDGVLYASLPLSSEEFAHCRELVERAWNEGGQTA